MKKIIAQLIAFLTPTLLFAQNTVNSNLRLLQGDLPGIGEETNLASYISGAFTLTMAIGAVIAFVMITYGGIIYATTDAISGKQNGRKYIRDAVTGLLILFGAFAILNTISPELVNLNIGFDKPEVTVPETPVVAGGQGGLTGCPQCSYRTLNNNGQVSYILNGYIMSDEQIEDDLTVRQTLSFAAQIPNTACTNGRENGCTNMNGLPHSVINGVRTMNSECSRSGLGASACKFVITGGTEGGHQTHGPGLSNIDIRASSLDAYLTKAGVTVPKDGKSHYIRIGTVGFDALYEGQGDGRSTGDHYHLSF